MWHEARKQEKKIRGLMVDYKKRADRRREFYEKIKLDPTQFLRVYGRPVKVNLDPAVAIAAESPQSMMPWQGDKENMIDRFDVRAHLDIMPKFNLVAPPILSQREEEEERRANYERYRTLVENESAGVSEEQALHQIYIDEMYGAVNKGPEDEKKKLAERKAAIGYTYEDSTPTPDKKEEGESEDEDSDIDVEAMDLDVTLDIDTLTNEQKTLLNQCAQTYGMKDEDFVCWLSRDKEEMEEIRQAKMLEEEKAQFAGRKSRRERRAYKEKKLAGRKLSPPSYAARDSPKYEPYQRKSSSSRSRSRSPEEPKKTKVEFITSFGGESDEEGVLQGPALPPQLSVSESSQTCKKKKEKKRRKRRYSSASRSRSRTPQKSQSKCKSPEKCKSFSEKTVNESPQKEKNGKRSGDTRMSSGSPRKTVSSASHSRSRSRSYSSSRSRSRSKSSRSRSRSSRSRSKSSRSSSRSTSPDKPVIKRYRRRSLSSSASSSDSESDRKGKSSIQKSGSGVGKTSLATSQVMKLTPQERLKRRMQAALNKQYKADKRADIERQNKMEQERMDREEELRIRTLEMRKREREKRHRELEGRQNSSDSDERSNSPQVRKRSPSPKHRSPKPERRRSPQPERRRSPFSDRRRSPLQDRRRGSPSERKKSPIRERNRGSPDRGRTQYSERRRSPGHLRRSGDRHRSPVRGRRERSPRSYRHRSRSRSRSRSMDRRPRLVNY
ncbi:CLK4-associating serine/arginine rich protein-like [Saccostrea echinata]|uniref:CLK4-associating serine/arginine rich protein-like n=1 Tax=Saccostrea echinata TaxID=191078 RepID=UPI002A81C2D1|nr:CLK4-associating serine/arginine rich protein-like [Saccostrea echinata]